MKTINLICAASLLSLSMAAEAQNMAQWPIPAGPICEMAYVPAATRFSVWGPMAEKARVNLYDAGEGGKPTSVYALSRSMDGTWSTQVSGDLQGKFYTFQLMYEGKWLDENPGIFAKAVGVNGRRAAIIDMDTTDPEGWENDERPSLNSFADIVLYEMHHRDYSIDPESGIKNKGKFLALTERGTKNADGASTGLDNLVELGVNHVHLLPSYDYASVDESKPHVPQYNWGYDPLNYNVPEGSYSTNAADPAVRIKEFKQMVQALHKAGIRVVLDVVYNHVFDVAGSNFERTAPGYFYRRRTDGSLADGSGCGNETASEMPMMRKYMIESVLYWINEYHIDGFRFDLMGIHDIETMNAIRSAVSGIDPTIFIYGEGWAAASPVLPAEQLAMKANTAQLPGIAAFGDEMRDGLRGPWNNDADGAFLIGLPGHEESIKFGVVGAINHPQVDYTKVNYSQTPWAAQPTQMISYVSCHDDMCLADRIKATVSPKAKMEERIRLHKLAETAVLTSQGVPFIWTGDEVMRDKKGVHNSYNSPDSINVIHWKQKSEYADVYKYIKDMIALRKHHPAFRLGDAEKVVKHLEFLPVKKTNVVAYRLKEHAGGDAWEDIYVVFNGNRKAVKLDVPKGEYTVVCRDGQVNEAGLGVVKGGKVSVPAQSAMIFYK